MSVTSATDIGVSTEAENMSFFVVSSILFTLLSTLVLEFNVIRGSFDAKLLSFLKIDVKDRTLLK